MVEQHFCLRWNNYRTNITAEFETLREGEHFVDVTLACDGHQLKAHKVVLSACSPYFKELLQGNPCTHPIIILRDVAYTHMRSLLEFMYAGEVNISQVHLGAFLHTAEALKIRGLAESPDERKDQGGLNSMSPLSALKSSLVGLGNIAMGGLTAPNLLERPIVPQLSSHPTESKPSGNPLTGPPHHLPPHLVPPPLTLPSSITLPTTCQGGGPPSTSSNSSSSGSTGANCNVTGVHPGPLPLTTMPQANERPPRLESSERSPSPQPPLPPSKRLRLERKPLIEPACTTPDKISHSHRESNGTAVNTTTTANIHPEDIPSTVPKIEPVDGGISDSEGVGGWGGQEEGDSSGGGGSVIGGGSGLGTGTGPGPGPGPGPVGDTKTTTPACLTPPGGGNHPDPENTSHLLQALSSESHLSGNAGPEEADRRMLCEEIRHDIRYDLPPDPRAEHRHDPPLDLRGDMRGDQRVDIRSDIRVVEVRSAGERTGTSPPLPPSSLPHSCQLCGKLISCRRNLWKHMERVHFNNPAVRCSLCAKMFKNKYALKDHQRIYHGGLSEPPPPPSHSASILSCILQDPRHQQPPPPHDPRGPPPLEMPQPALIPRDSHMRHHMDSPHTQPLPRRHHEEEDFVGATAYPSMGMGPIIPQSLAPTIGGSPSLNRSRPDWPAQDDPLSMSLVNRALLSELQHLVTKAD